MLSGNVYLVMRRAASVLLKVRTGRLLKLWTASETASTPATTPTRKACFS
jgi:hypothetical protein